MSTALPESSRPQHTTVQRPAVLDGIRVLDLSRVLAGPWCTMILGDLGADVIKVEPPGTGDDTRAWGPPYAATESAYYLCANRNKRSIAVNLASPEGSAIVRRLAGSADVVVENFKCGGLAKFGLDYASIASTNPSIVYCSITGYGHESPLAQRPGYDYVIQAEAGLMAVTGAADGEPTKVGVAVADLFTGMAAAQAVLAALFGRARDGIGQHIDMALYDCQLAMLANVGSAYLVSGQEPARYGNGHPTVVPYQTFMASDGPIVVAIGNDRQFETFCTHVIAHPELGRDARFVSNSQRVRNREQLVELIQKIMIQRKSAEWLDAMRAKGIPCAQVRSVGAALDAPETRERGLVKTLDHPRAGRISLVGSPLRLVSTPPRDPLPPPTLGQHTDEVLSALCGYRTEDLARARRSGAIA